MWNAQIQYRNWNISILLQTKFLSILSNVYQLIYYYTFVIVEVYC